MTFDRLFALGALFTFSLLACADADSNRAGPTGGGGGGAGAGAGIGGHAGGSGGSGGAGIPFSSGSGRFEQDWHQAIRCQGNVASAFSALHLVAGRPTLAGWVDGNCGLFDSEPSQSEGDEPVLAALEPNGAPSWSARYAAAGDQRFNQLASSGSGLMLTGSLDATFDFGGMTVEPVPSSDVPYRSLFLARLDHAGAPTWVKPFAINAIFAGAKLAGAPNGDVLLAGTAARDINFGGGNVPASIFSRFIVRYDAAGTHLFSQLVDSSSGLDSVDIQSVAVDAAGNAWIVGTFSKDVNIGGKNLAHSSAAMFLALLDRSGTLVGSQIFSPANECIMSLRSTVKGMLMGGRCAGPFDFGQGALGTSAPHHLLAHYDTDLKLGWALDLGPAVDSLCFDGTASGGALVGGSFLGKLSLGKLSLGKLSLGSEDLISAGRRDAFVATISASGAIASAQRFGGEYDEIFEDLRVMPNGFVATGRGLLETPDTSRPSALRDVVRFSAKAD